MKGSDLSWAPPLLGGDCVRRPLDRDRLGAQRFRQLGRTIEGALGAGQNVLLRAFVERRAIEFLILLLHRIDVASLRTCPKKLSQVARRSSALGP